MEAKTPEALLSIAFKAIAETQAKLDGLIALSKKGTKRLTMKRKPRAIEKIDGGVIVFVNEHVFAL